MNLDSRTDQKVSIIVPVYKAEGFIRETIKQVQAQSYTDLELILVVDGSPDNSAKIIEAEAKKDPRIKPIIKTENEGAAAARNTGIDAAKGRYIAFLDADDVWYPEKLKKELEFMKKKQAGFVFTAYEFGDENARPTGKVVHVPEVLEYKKALSRTIIFTSTVMLDLKKIPRELCRMPLIESEDTATWWRLLKNGINAYGLDDVLVIYRRPGKSLSSNKAKAVKRIWGLYRNIAKLSVIQSVYYLLLWAIRATLRRL